MDTRADNLIKNWQKRNISGFYCDNKSEAIDKILKIIPQDKSVGISGSKTLEEIGIVSELIRRGNKVFNQYEKGLTAEQSLAIRNQGAAADVFLSSANAITKQGEMVFFSGHGHRIAGIANAKNTIIVCGLNKIVDNIEKGLDRARNYATPLNCKRLGTWNTACAQDGICRMEVCLFPEYKRMCCQILIIESEVNPDRLKVILVGENLGF